MPVEQIVDASENISLFADGVFRIEIDHGIARHLAPRITVVLVAKYEGGVLNYAAQPNIFPTPFMLFFISQLTYIPSRAGF